MKTIKKISILLFLFAITIVTAQKELKTGTVKFKMTSDNEQMAMMGDVKLNFYFANDKQAMEMDMMSGMVNMKFINDFKNPEGSAYLMNSMGKKINITDANKNGQDISKGIDVSNLANAISVTYDKKDVKTILGYSCYKANLVYKENKTGTFYITDKIIPAKDENKKTVVELTGYPLEMEMVDESGSKINIVATEISAEIPADCFTIPADYDKMTMEELQKNFKQ